jgi:gamma-glutamyltranspeptidase/glutathione hydrolase
MRMFRRGGNAIDAGVAAGIALGVVERDMVDFGGVAPIMVLRPGMAEPETFDGLGRWPRQYSLADHVDRFGLTMPPGVPRTVTPGAPDSWLSALAKHGTLTLAEVLEPSIELAGGFPVFPRLAAAIAEDEALIRRWPSSAAVFLPHGRVPQVGESSSNRIYNDYCKNWSRRRVPRVASAARRRSWLPEMRSTSVTSPPGCCASSSPKARP